MKLSQCQRIMRYMEDFGSITTAQAMLDLGVYRLAARINDLRRQGYVIKSEQVKSVNRYGEQTHFAKYYLAKEN